MVEFDETLYIRYKIKGETLAFYFSSNLALDLWIVFGSKHFMAGLMHACSALI